MNLHLSPATLDLGLIETLDISLVAVVRAIVRLARRILAVL